MILYDKKDTLHDTGMWAAMPIIRDILYGAARHGAPVEKLCQLTGIDIQSLENPGEKIPIEQAQQVWQEAVALTGDPHLGLHIGENTTTSVVGMVGHLMQTSSTVAEAFENLSRFTEVVTGMFSYHTQLTENQFSIYFNPSPYWQQHYNATAQQAIDQAMAGSLNVLRLLTGRTIVPQIVDFERPQPAQTQEYERVLKEVLYFGQPYNRLVFDASVANFPVLGFNKDLQAIFKKMSEEVLQQSIANTSFSQTVQQTIITNFNNCIPTLAQVASYFSVTERTLQRRLEKEATSFHKITEEIRKELAIKLLNMNKYTISQAAYMLGYAEPAVFRRAIKRWTGKTPREIISAV